MSLPEQYRGPQATYAPLVERVVVAGFDREVFRQTSGTSGNAIWGGQASASASGPAIAGTATGNKTWGSSVEA
jgi:hypothetical protein